MSKKDRPLSGISSWVAAGGRLRHSLRFRASHPVLYPHFDKTKLPPIDPFAMAGLVLLLVMVGAFVYYFQSRYGSRDGDNVVASVIELPELVVSLTPIPKVLTNEPIGVLPLANVTLEPTVVVLDIPAFRVDDSRPTSVPVVVSPEPELCFGCQSHEVEVRVGWFYPPLGGSHCPYGGVCENEELADRGEWFFRQGLVAACPLQFPLGSIISIAGIGDYECAHRLPLSTCRFVPLQVCDVLVLSPVAVSPDWRFIYQAVLWVP